MVVIVVGVYIVFDSEVPKAATADIERSSRRIDVVVGGGTEVIGGFSKGEAVLPERLPSGCNLRLRFIRNFRDRGSFLGLMLSGINHPRAE